MNWLGKSIQDELDIEDTVLDVGCGIMQGSDDLLCKSMLGCDIFPKYLNKIKNKWNTVILGAHELDRFVDESYDFVICLDVVEHLERELALKVLDELKRIARKKVIVYTPSEFHENLEQVKDSWGMGYNEAQKHKCLISRVDFKLKGYKTKKSDTSTWAIWCR